MNWKVGTGLTLLALESLAVLYLFLTRRYRRISGPWLIGVGALGAALGSAFVMHSGVGLFPFDPNDDVSVSLLGAEGSIPADFAVGVLLPFLFLAVRVLMTKDKRNKAVK